MIKFIKNLIFKMRTKNRIRKERFFDGKTYYSVNVTGLTKKQGKELIESFKKTMEEYHVDMKNIISIEELKKRMMPTI